MNPIYAKSKLAVGDSWKRVSSIDMTNLLQGQSLVSEPIKSISVNARAEFFIFTKDPVSPLLVTMSINMNRSSKRDKQKGMNCYKQHTIPDKYDRKINDSLPQHN